MNKRTAGWAGKHNRMCLACERKHWSWVPSLWVNLAPIAIQVYLLDLMFPDKRDSSQGVCTCVCVRHIDCWVTWHYGSQAAAKSLNETHNISLNPYANVKGTLVKCCLFSSSEVCARCTAGCILSRLSRCKYIHTKVRGWQARGKEALLWLRTIRSITLYMNGVQWPQPRRGRGPTHFELNTSFSAS